MRHAETELGCGAAVCKWECTFTQIIGGYILWRFSMAARFQIQLMGYFAALLNP